MGRSCRITLIEASSILLDECLAFQPARSIDCPAGTHSRFLDSTPEEDMAHRSNRREFIRDLGIGAAALPFVLNLPSLGFANQQRRKQRLVVMFSPNGVVPSAFWPDEEGPSFKFKESLKPLEPFRDRTLILHGVCDKLRGDGDNHMRGMGCLADRDRALSRQHPGWL